MKLLCRLMSLVLAAALLAGCGAAGGTAAATGAAQTEADLAQIAALGESPDDDYRTWYEVFVYSFCDSDGDGVGDLNGVAQKLDYLQELGVTGIWLMPISPSPSYHKYDVTDYTAIDPQYGTMEDFDALLAACHERGIRVILDLVVNHSSSQHLWFVEAARYLRELPAGAEPDPAACPSVAYYNFVPADQARSGFNTLAGTGWAYECPFSSDMPDLNWDSAALREQVRQIMAFWLDKGVDGFRLDAAKEFYSGNAEKNVEVLAWLQTTARQLAPNAYLVAEVWEDQTSIARYYESGITSIFDYPFGNYNGGIIRALRGAGQAKVVENYANSLERVESSYRAANPDFIDAPFLSNHDVGRIYGFAVADPSRIKLAGAMNLFMGGSAFIYYGEELGMQGSGDDPSKRAPMYWNEARDNGTTDPPPGCTLAECPLGSLEQQRDDDASVYNYYRRAIAIRSALPAIARGVTTAETALNQGTISAIRKSWNDQACLILYNINTEPAQVDLAAYADWTLAASLSADGGAITLDGSTLELAPFGAAVLTQAAG